MTESAGYGDWTQFRGSLPAIQQQSVADEAARHGMTLEQWLPVREQTLQAQYQRDIASSQSHDIRNRAFTAMALTAAGAGLGAALGPAGAAAGGSAAPAAGAALPAGGGVLAAAPTTGAAIAAGAPAVPTIFAGAGLPSGAAAAGAPLAAGGGVLAPAGGASTAAPSSGASFTDKLGQLMKLQGLGGGGGAPQGMPSTRRFQSMTPVATVTPREQVMADRLMRRY